MSEWIAIAPATLLSDGTMTEIKAGENLLLLARVDGSYYAVQHKCPHLGGRLAQGKLEGFTLRCPLHDSRFDLRDGHVIIWLSKFPEFFSKLASALKKPAALHTFPTRIQDDQVWVRLE